MEQRPSTIVITWTVHTVDGKSREHQYRYDIINPADAVNEVQKYTKEQFSDGFLVSLRVGHPVMIIDQPLCFYRTEHVIGLELGITGAPQEQQEAVQRSLGFRPNMGE